MAVAKSSRNKKSTSSSKNKKSTPKIGESIYEKCPKCFVVPRGLTATMPAHELLKDLQAVMLPHTSTKLRARRNQKTRDFLAVAKPLSLTHLQVLSQTQAKQKEEKLFRSVNPIRLTWSVSCLPSGPTLTFDVLSYSTRSDIRRNQKNPRHSHTDYATPPLMVMQGMASIGMENEKASEIVKSLLTGMYASIDVERVKLNDCRRVLLYSYKKGTKISEQQIDQVEQNIPPYLEMLDTRNAVDFRHYAVQRTQGGIKKNIRKILNRPVNLGNNADVSDYILKNKKISQSGYATSDSEAENTPQLNILPDNPTHQSSTIAIKLIELGPRMQLRLVKIREGVLSGTTIYHMPTQTD